MNQEFKNRSMKAESPFASFGLASTVAHAKQMLNGLGNGFVSTFWKSAHYIRQGAL